MILKLKARLSNKSSISTSPHINDTPDSEDDGGPGTPSLLQSLSANLQNPKRMIDQKEMIHALLFGIQSANKKLIVNNTLCKKGKSQDLGTFSPSQLQENCKYSFKVICPHCGSDSTDSHEFSNFDFECFAPMVFEQIRLRFGFQSEEYSDEFVYKLSGISPETGKKSIGKEPLNLSECIKNFKSMTTNSKSG